MLVPVTIPAGQTFQPYGHVRAFWVLGNSNGATFRVDGGGIFSLGSGYYKLPGGHDVGFSPGTTVPLQILLDLVDDGEPIEIQPSGGFQEGDLASAVGGGSVVGSGGAPPLLLGPGRVFAIPTVDASGNQKVSQQGTVTVGGTVAVSGVSGTVTVRQPGASSYTSVAATTTAANQNVTPATGTGNCVGFYAVNQGTTATQVLQIADTSANLTANKLLLQVPFNSTSEIIPYDFTNGAGTLFAEGPAAFTYTIVALWRS
jgi:hypothetical protein